MRFVSVATPDFKSFLSQITFFVPQITENLASEILKILELILIPSGLGYCRIRSRDTAKMGLYKTPVCLAGFC